MLYLFDMKRLNILWFSLLLLFLSNGRLYSQDLENIIQNIDVQTDYVQNGVKGLRISNTCDFNVLRKKYGNDSLMKIALRQSRFSYVMTFFQDTTQLEPAFGYQHPGKKKEYLEFKIDCKPILNDLKNITYPFVQFIPYASLKLPNGRQSIQVKYELNGKDGFNASYKQSTQSPDVTFMKPVTKIFECSLDSLVIKPFNAQGQAWDHSVFGTDAPDLDFSIIMGDLEVGNIHKGNSYYIAFPDKPRVFRFLISENDEVSIVLKDSDDVFHDPIASWRFDTANMKDNVTYQQKEAKTNMQAFSFRCKVGKTKN